MIQAEKFKAADLNMGNETEYLEKIEGLAGSLRESEGQVKALHKIIISSGLEPPGPLDDDVVLSFDRLFFGIRQVVGKYCRGCELKDCAYEKLSLANKNLWVTATIADRLYSQLFVPNVALFGFKPQWNVCLANLEEELSQGGNGTLLPENCNFYHLQQWVILVPSSCWRHSRVASSDTQNCTATRS
jgi:hypothetical protein